MTTGKLILVLGFAGSGKSHLIRAIRHETDFVIEEGFAGDQYETNLCCLIQALCEGKHCIVSEIEYLNSDRREALIDCLRNSVDSKFQIHTLCFEGDIVAANHNCRNRTDEDKVNFDPDGEKHVGINQFYSSEYTIPDNSIVMKIHQVQRK